MKTNTIIWLCLIPTLGFSQIEVTDLLTKMAGNKVKVTKLNIRFTLGNDETTKKGIRVGVYALQVGKHQGTYKVFMPKEQRYYGVITLDNIQISLKSPKDDINGDRMTSQIMTLSLSAHYIDLKQQRFLCLSFVNGGTGSFASYLSVYLVQINSAHPKIHRLVLKYSDTSHFGDFNNEGQLDLIRRKRFDPSPHIKKGETIWDAFELNAYTLTTKGFVPLDHKKYRVQGIIRQSYGAVELLKYKWFY